MVGGASGFPSVLHRAYSVLGASVCAITVIRSSTHYLVRSWNHREALCGFVFILCFFNKTTKFYVYQLGKYTLMKRPAEA